MPRVVPSQAISVIDSWFPWAAQQSCQDVIPSGWIPAIPGLVNLLKQIPDDLLQIEPLEYAQFVRCIGELETTVGYWLARGATDASLNASGRLDPVTLARQLLAKYPDEFPARSIVQLSFIGDTERRDAIRQDIDEAEIALQNSRWKAATVSAGVAVEALLLWALEQLPEARVAESAKKLRRDGKFTRRSATPLWELSLGDFIVLAESLDLIRRDTASQAELGKNFRNLIHPGRTQIRGHSCDRATARSALAALDHVIRDLMDEKDLM